MSVDQWIATIAAIVAGVAIRVIDHFWPDLGRSHDASTGPDNPSTGSVED